MDRDADGASSAAEVRLDGVQPDGVGPRWNISPTQAVIAVIAGRHGDGDAPERSLAWLRWGLVPPWTRDQTAARGLINARAETVSSKPSFRRAFARRRCILPADGFYEWQAGEKPGERRRRIPYYARASDGDLLALGAVWEERHSPGGVVLGSCAILTTAANAALAQVHDRMPVLLPRSAWDRWLAPEPLDEASRDELLRPAADDLLVTERVSTKVNDPRADGPFLIESPAT